MVIRGYVQELLVDERITDPEIQEDLRRIEAQTGRMDAIIKHLRGFSRESTLRRQCIDLNQVVRDAFTFLAQQLKLRGVEVVYELAPTLPSVWGDPLQLEQVVLNLVTNARDAMEGGADRTLTIRTEQKGPETVSLQVVDTGSGIQSALQERIFDPFFTTKEIGKGTGLGLSICHGIIQAHGGKIEVESPVTGKRGTRFNVLLPCRATDRGEGSARPGEEMPPPGGVGKEQG
jgi:signal transduction histidine kinase